MQSSDMSRGRAATWLTGVFVAAFTLTLGGILFAGNQWWCWHWPGPNVGISVVADGSGANDDSHWQPILTGEIADWGTTCMNFSSGTDITVEAGFYGINGWLGLARLLDYDSGACEIKKAEALSNRDYLDGAGYDAIDDMHVPCQEIGHTLGLDHRKGPRNQTCMNDMFLGFPDFNDHDAATIAEINCPGDGGGGGGGGGTDPDPCANNGEKGKKKCNDGIDNDLDGCIDGADPDCQ